MLTGSDSKSECIDFKKEVITGKWIVAQLSWPDFQTCCLKWNKWQEHSNFSKHCEAYILKKWAFYGRLLRQKHNVNSFNSTW